MITLTKLLSQAKYLNVSQWNVISQEDLQKAIKDTIMKYKEIIFGADTPICIESLNEIQIQQVINEIKSSWKVQYRSWV